MACNCNGSCGLSAVPTCDLVKERISREGVVEQQAGPGDIYRIHIATPGRGESTYIDRGPARILVVVD
jgi:hypothetical protein